MWAQPRIAVVAVAASVCLALAGCGESAGKTGARMIAGSRAPVSSSTSAPPIASVGSSPTDASTVASGAPTPVVPRSGQPNVHQIPVESITAAITDHKVVAHPVWQAGAAPCHVLDHYDVTQQGRTYTIALFEGGDQTAICPMYVISSTTDVDLGPLPRGTYTIVGAQPGGGAQPSTTVTVP